MSQLTSESVLEVWMRLQRMRRQVRQEPRLQSSRCGRLLLLLLLIGPEWLEGPRPGY